MTWEEFIALEPARQVNEVLTALNQVISEAPHGAGTVYQKHIDPGACTYIAEQTRLPMCIVGRVLIRLGCPSELLMVNGAVSEKWQRWGICRDTAMVLAAAQGVQDQHGGTWGNAQDAAAAVARVALLV